MLHQVVIGVDVHPLTVSLARGDRSPDQLAADASSLMSGVHGCVEHEEVNPAVPSDVHEAD